jgi:hypothetical protein
MTAASAPKDAPGEAVTIPDEYIDRAVAFIRSIQKGDER